MPAFWIVAALLTVVALAFVLVPLLRRRASDAPTVREANLAALRSQRQEIESDVSLGVLAPEAKEEALAELVARASEDLEAPAEAQAAGSKRPWPAAIAFAMLVPACAFGFYLWVGLPAALDPSAVAAGGPGGTQGAFGDHQMEELVVQLAQKVRERPDDVQGWNLLARSYNAMGRNQDALEAYAHLAKIAPNDPQVLADYADALALARGKNLSGEPAEIIQRALKIDPKHPKSLALAGTVTLNEGKFAESVGYWERLYTALPPDSQDLGEIRNIIEDVRGRAAAAGKPLPPSKLVAGAPAPAKPGPMASPPAMAAAPPAMPPASPKAVAVPGKGLSGTVKLAEALAGRVSPTDTLFIYARAAQGSRMPLAILRGGARELPKNFDLDDSMGMAPNVRLSETPSVVIEARVSKAGGAMAQPGDLIGTSAPVAPGAKGVAIVIDKVVP
ncbi:MAG: c-type cytochrome biogenesis protein CcmI [Betaproteobacteria bacterium]|nr:c-type cytochrome biogenesis protein CcmI [Betaproteobacteria bacterium]